MKKLIATLAMAGLAIGAFAQGTVALQNGTLVNQPGITDVTDGNYYSGPLTVEVWLLPGTTDPGLTSYAAISSVAGAKLEVTASGTAGALEAGLFDFGTVTLPDAVAGPSATDVLGLVAFNASSVATSTHSGGITFAQIGMAGLPPVTPGNLTGWDNKNVDIVMTAVPEPATFAMLGMGAAAMLIFRRRS